MAKPKTWSLDTHLASCDTYLVKKYFQFSVVVINLYNWISHNMPTIHMVAIVIYIKVVGFAILIIEISSCLISQMRDMRTNSMFITIKKANNDSRDPASKFSRNSSISR